MRTRPKTLRTKCAGLSLLPNLQIYKQFRTFGHDPTQRVLLARRVKIDTSLFHNRNEFFNFFFQPNWTV